VNDKTFILRFCFRASPTVMGCPLWEARFAKVPVCLNIFHPMNWRRFC
jgi:hypothetical protein